MAVAADVKVLSAGAVELGLPRAAEQFERSSGKEIKVNSIPRRNSSSEWPRVRSQTF